MTDRMTFTQFTTLVTRITANAFLADIRMNSDMSIVVRDAWIPRSNVSSKSDSEIEQLRGVPLPFKTQIAYADWYVAKVQWS